MDDVSPGIVPKSRIIVEILTGNYMYESRSWLHPTQDFLQVLQVENEFPVVFFTLVQSGPNRSGERASLLAVFLGVLDEHMEVVAQC